MNVVKVTRVEMGMHDCGSHSCAASGKGADTTNAQISGGAKNVKLNLEKIGSGSLAKVGRPPVEIRDQIAQNIRANSGYAQTLRFELELGDSPMCFCGTPVLDEAEAEKREGGGPIADAVEWFRKDVYSKEVAEV